jgi:hypothetical protein
MKNEEVKIGMKVVPHDKTANNWCNLEDSWEWQHRIHPFLYVTEWNSDDECWCLSNENIPNTTSADFFNSEDFEIFVGDEENWQDDLVEPSALELAQMNASAEELRLQFEGE